MRYPLCSPTGATGTLGMALKKSDLYSSLWASCDELRGGMDASQYKDYVLFMLFIKYVSAKAPRPPWKIGPPRPAKLASSRFRLNLHPCKPSSPPNLWRTSRRQSASA